MKSSNDERTIEEGGRVYRLYTNVGRASRFYRKYKELARQFPILFRPAFANDGKALSDSTVAVFVAVDQEDEFRQAALRV